MRKKYSLALLLVPACLVYACGGGDDSATSDDGGGGSEGGNTIDGTVPNDKDGSVSTQDGSVFGKDSGAKDGGGDSSKDGATDSSFDATPVFDGNYPYPLPDGASPVIQFAGIGFNMNPDVEFIDGLQWVPQYGAVLVSDAELGGTGTLYKYTIDAGAPIAVPGYNFNPIGNALLADAGFFTGSEKGTLYFSPIDGGPPVPFATGYSGARFNQPNDVVVRNDGFVYATDPNYSSDYQPGTSVFLIRPDGGVSPVVGPNAVKPEYNGLAFSPDQKTLYVGITDTGAINKYTVNADGSLTAAGSFITADGGTTTRHPSPDGLAVDDAGNVYVGVANGVEIYNSGGAFIGFITLTNRLVSSLAFGGADRRTLFIAANDLAGDGKTVNQDGKSALYRIYMNVPGGPTK